MAIDYVMNMVVVTSHNDANALPGLLLWMDGQMSKNTQFESFD